MFHLSKPRCLQCGLGVKVVHRQFCSKTCANQSRTGTYKWNTQSAVGYCPCGRVYSRMWKSPDGRRQPDVAKKFCNQKCARAHSGGGRKPRLHKVCQGVSCNVMVTANRTYCSQACVRRKDYSAWLNGGDWAIATKPRGGLLYTARSAYLERFGRFCSECDWSKPNPALGVVMVEVDHKDGDRYHNHVDNLRVLCPSCHSLTPTYRMLNRRR